MKAIRTTVSTEAETAAATAIIITAPEEKVPLSGADDAITLGLVATEVGFGVAPTVVKLPVTQALVSVIALVRTRQ